MIDLDITTPALLFPAISLLFLSYTNKFMVTGQLIRSLVANIEEGKSFFINEQIKNLKKRMLLIKWMQILGGTSLLSCTISTLFLFLGYSVFGGVLFFLALFFMAISLWFTIWESLISTDAVSLELKGMDKVLHKD